MKFIISAKNYSSTSFHFNQNLISALDSNKRNSNRASIFNRSLQKKLLPLCILFISNQLMADNTPNATAANATNVNTTDSPVIQTIVVNGSHIPNAEAGVAIQLNKNDIEQKNSGSLVELLRGVPGLDVSQPGGAGGVTELFIRGAESNFTLVTVNGVRVNDTTNSHGGAFDLSTINPDDIESIEILKGPSSSAYGSDAVAGALNIVTQKPHAGTQIKLREDLGQQGYNRSYLSINLGDQDLAGVVRASRNDSGDLENGSAAKTQSVGSDILWNLSSNNQLSATATYINRDRTSFPAGSGGALYSVSKKLETSESTDKQFGLTWTSQINQQFNINSHAQYFERDEQVQSPAIVPGVSQGVPASTSDTNLERKNINLVAVYEFSPQLSNAVGVDYQTENGISRAVYDFGFPVPSGFNLSRDNLGVFAEVNYKNAQGLETFLSVRSDKPENHRQENSSKISIAYPLLGDNSRVGASWGEAFKLPSFYALGDKLVGNPALKSETSESSELFLNQSFMNNLFHINASLYHTEYRELIDFDFKTFKLVNRNKVFVKGGELEFVVNPFAGLELGTHWMHNTYEIQDIGGSSFGPLKGRPENSNGFYVEWINNSWSSRLQWTQVGTRPSDSTPTGPVNLNAYSRVDVVVVKKISPDLSVTLNLDNLTDEKYQDEVGFPSLGRRLRLGLAAQF